MLCPIHKIKMTELFMSFICDNCSPPAAQASSSQASVAKTSTGPQAIKYKPCVQMDIDFLVNMQSACVREYSIRGLGNFLNHCDMRLIVGSEVYMNFVRNNDILDATSITRPSNVPSFCYFGTVNGTPTYTDAYRSTSQQFLGKYDIYLTNWDFKDSEFSSGQVIQNALLGNAIVFHSTMV